jgi:hypothetical protein
MPSKKEALNFLESIKDDMELEDYMDVREYVKKANPGDFEEEVLNLLEYIIDSMNLKDHIDVRGDLEEEALNFLEFIRISLKFHKPEN